MAAAVLRPRHWAPDGGTVSELVEQTKRRAEMGAVWPRPLEACLYQHRCGGAWRERDAIPRPVPELRLQAEGGQMPGL